MEFLPDFTVLRPTDVETAITGFTTQANARYIAGGTDLMVNIRRGIAEPETLIDLSGIPEMSTIEEDGKGGFRIGASVTLNQLLKHKTLCTDYTAIKEAAAEIAAPTHRQVATVGGNLCLDTRCIFYNQSEWWRNANNYCLKYQGDVCHVAPSGQDCFAAFSGDLAPALMVFNAEVEIVGTNGHRTLALRDLYENDGRNHLRLEPGEILTSVLLPAAKGMTSGYAKARVRQSIDFPLAGAAMAVRKNGTGLEELRLALTGIKSCPVLVEGTGAFRGKKMDDAALDALTALLPKQIKPMTSTFTPPGYRRKVVANLSRSLAVRLIA